MGKEILALLKVLQEWTPIGFYDDQLQKGTFVNGIRILGNVNQLKIDSTAGVNLVVAIGNPVIKKKVVSKLKNIVGINYPSLLHPSAIIMDPTTIKIGKGSIVGAGCILTTGIIIGKHVLVNINTTIGHDGEIGDYSSIMPGVNLAGEVKLGSEVLIGSGANILNGIVLGERCKVGMGAVVIQNIDKATTAVGVPAKMIRNT